MRISLVVSLSVAMFSSGSGAEKTPVEKTPTVEEVKKHMTPAQLALGDPITNSVGMVFVPIPAGEFMMGSPANEKRGVSNEDQHRVRITQAFHLGIFEVTQAQYERVMDKKPSHFSASGGGKDKVFGRNTTDFPVERVSWDDAVEFCRRLSDLPKERTARNTYRLPTEAEWEYACRAGTKTPYSFGTELNGKQANCNGSDPYGTTSKGPYLNRTTPVGSFAPNAFGLYDTTGNVFEWCADWYANYENSPLNDPRGPSTGSVRVCRGGSWDYYAWGCRSAFRGVSTPGFRLNTLGFRVLGSSMQTPVENPPDAAEVKKHMTPVQIALGDPITNSVGMVLVPIPAGEFMMGSPESEKGRRANEHQHRVQITQTFHLGAFEVTQSQYERVMGKNPSDFSSGGGSKERVTGRDTRDFPVETVSWNDAVEFCRRLSDLREERSAGNVYRLPTEAEWEYACRAGTTTPLHFGRVLNGKQANCYGDYPYGTETQGPFLKRTTRVGSFAPNAFGLYDMHGNAFEWCADRFDEGYYKNSPVDDPRGPSTGSFRVDRGGSWRNVAGDCRSAYRRWSDPEDRNRSLGFRVLRSSVE